MTQDLPSRTHAQTNPPRDHHRATTAGRSRVSNDSASRPAAPRCLVNVLLGLVIRHCRETSRLTQEAVAERAGCHVTYLSAIENGRADLSIKTFDRLCKALAVSASWLYLAAEGLEKDYLASEVALKSGRDSANPLTAQFWLREYLQTTDVL